jgi:hypothetical protein
MVGVVRDNPGLPGIRRKPKKYKYIILTKDPVIATRWKGDVGKWHIF